MQYYYKLQQGNHSIIYPVTLAELKALEDKDKRIAVVTAARDTLREQIKRLKNFTPAIQLKIWRQTLSTRNKELKHLKREKDFLLPKQLGER